MEAARYDGATFDVVKRWFDAIATKVQEHTYEPSNIWNMDESGFNIGESQSTKVLVSIDKQQKNKRVVGKQEWVTVIEAINAAGEALPSMIIWKGKHLNSGWLPAETPKDWHFGTSENGWTSNELELRWLMEVFEPQIRKTASNKQRLLIIDGHGSHIQAKFIAHCMENGIDLLVMPPHCSHLLQPLDVGVFAAFKRAHSVEMDSVSRLSTQRISRHEWLQMFIRARVKAVTTSNILAGWRGAGLIPFNPSKVLKNLPSQPPLPQRPIYTPTDQSVLDLTLLKSSPPDGTELHESNIQFTALLRQHSDVLSPVKRYAERMTRMCETQNATIAIMAKQLEEQSKLLNTRKTHTRGKRVKLDGVSVYSTSQVLEVAHEAEKKPETKRPRGRPRKRPIEEIISESEDEVLETSPMDSDIELEDCVGRRTRSRR